MRSRHFLLFHLSEIHDFHHLLRHHQNDSSKDCRVSCLFRLLETTCCVFRESVLFDSIDLKDCKPSGGKEGRRSGSKVRKFRLMLQGSRVNQSIQLITYDFGNPYSPSTEQQRFTGSKHFGQSVDLLFVRFRRRFRLSTPPLLLATT